MAELEATFSAYRTVAVEKVDFEISRNRAIFCSVRT